MISQPEICTSLKRRKTRIGAEKEFAEFGAGGKRWTNEREADGREERGCWIDDVERGELHPCEVDCASWRRAPVAYCHGPDEDEASRSISGIECFSYSEALDLT